MQTDGNAIVDYHKRERFGLSTFCDVSREVECFERMQYLRREPFLHDHYGSSAGRVMRVRHPKLP